MLAGGAKEEEGGGTNISHAAPKFGMRAQSESFGGGRRDSWEEIQIYGSNVAIPISFRTREYGWPRGTGAGMMRRRLERGEGREGR